MLEKLFELRERGTSVKIEIIAGITTFLSMAYIIFVNPEILSNAGMPKSALVIVTCLATALATIMTGLIAKTPIAMAPGMGLNAFFAYSLVIGKKVNWETALGIVFISGLVFFILSIIGARDKIVKSIPSVIVDATSVGIGLFIAFIGFQNMALVVDHQATLLCLGKLTTTVLIGLAGLLLIVFLEIKKIKGSILIGIFFSTVLAIILKQVPMPEKMINLNLEIAQVFLKLDILSALKWSFAGVIFTLMFIDMFDSIGTIMACLKEAGLTDEEGNFKKLRIMLVLDAIATMGGALLGTSTTTSYIESATGIEEGGRTGLSAIVTGILFLVSMPFFPIIAVVPNYATAPALIVVGLFMIRRVKDVDFSDLESGFPAFLTIMLMPLTYSISIGMSFGFISYTFIKLLRGKLNEISPILWTITGLAILSLIL